MKCKICDGSGYMKCLNEVCTNVNCTYIHCIDINGIKYHNINYKICNNCNGTG